MLLLTGCAAGELSELPDGLHQADSTARPDLPTRKDSAPPDRPRPDSRPWDLRPADQAQLRDGQGTDSTGSCADKFEPNDSCAAAGDLGLVYEGRGYSGQSATLHPATDSDWYFGLGKEVGSICWPGDPQCFRLTIRLDVPAGRRLRACLYRGSCTSGPVCDSNTTPGPASLELEYTVAGTCGVSDDTTALIQVTNEDSVGGCAPYGIAFRYHGCGGD